MKIAIGTNIFGSYHRQDMCIKSLKRLKSYFGEVVDLYNIQDPDDSVELDLFTRLPILKNSSKDILHDSNKKKPLVFDMFDGLSKLNGYDYMLFTNSDIIISNRFIQKIIDNDGVDSFSASRLTIDNINSLDDTPKLVQYQVAGFDAFAVKISWWENNKDFFPNYIYSEPCWDVHYATLFKRLGNSIFENKWPPSIFHIKHDIAWSDMTPERKYNEELLFKKHKNDSDMWHKFLFNVLLKRKPVNGFYNPLENEEHLEGIYFKS